MSICVKTFKTLNAVPLPCLTYFYGVLLPSTSKKSYIRLKVWCDNKKMMSSSMMQIDLTYLGK